MNRLEYRCLYERTDFVWGGVKLLVFAGAALCAAPLFAC